ncbi:YgaP family membrane protein [Pleionea sediminis]|uniref:YgaP family membrane protein n=1 Tax=Pleionea sediminis TaxID=2569479 RepID=UPI00118642AE|nr:DUF2892 domain-containing protein [Pleionea sediminis]
MIHKQRLSLEKTLDAFAGFMVLVSVSLTVWVHPNFIWFTVFIGANLLQQSFTGFCPASIIMHRVFHIKSERELLEKEFRATQSAPQ